jgi:type II secretory pathway component GspD/PulD (secretin)
MTLHADDTPLVEILNYVSRNLDVTFSIGDRIIWVTPRQSNTGDVPMETRMYRLRKAISADESEDAEEGIDIVRTIKRFVPDEQGSDLLFNRKAHMLIARNTRDNLSLVEDIIEALDVCPPQILIEARFITTDVNDLGELGIDWVLNSAVGVTKKDVIEGGAEVTKNKTEIETGATAGFTAFDGAAQGLNFSYQGILTDPLFKATLHALETSGKSRTLSVPRVTTVNNRPAKIRIGKDFRYFEQYDVQSIPAFSGTTTTYQSILVPVGTPALEDLGIELEVVPSVGADLGSVSLSMKPKIRDFIRYEYYATGGANNNGAPNSTNGLSMVKIPIFSTSELETEVIVQSGQTVVMGGLITSSETKSESRVPLLSYIPLIGLLFRHDVSTEMKQNLLIFVTATIVSEWGESLVPLNSVGEPAETAPAAAPAAVSVGG